ncbi:uncharacterized protein At4g37920, chloroplastic-like isoform X1 [Ananas comosus]|uniref:Uncharacterized protein At4g37920, chloroplastic-like isoform X1 n=2 Tax=Ananas comosus TaxID=4615 RepID=A0A6P5GD02_ANACO|nr:uncharacterized protein At4g37920, chloroplastic-like isoform X1 [Ananas comosus]
MALKTPPLPTPTTKSLHPPHPFRSHGDATLFPQPPLLCTHHPYSLSLSRRTHHRSHSFVPPGCVARNTTLSNTEEHDETEVARGYTMTQFCDKMIDFFMIEKPQTKDWRKILVFRDDWSKYRENFFNRCHVRADTEKDPSMKQKLVGLARKVKKIDDEIEKHMDLLKEVQESPLDINAIVARRRKDFTGEFFRHLTVFSNTYDNLDDRDAIVRLGAKCLSAVRAYDCALEQLETSDAAQKKFDDILNSSSLDEACEKIKSLAKAKELDSSLVLLINRAWAAAKESMSMTNEVKEIMHSIYKATKKSLRSIAPPEIKLLKYLLNITDPEKRFSALATAFSPGDEHEVKDVDALYTYYAGELNPLQDKLGPLSRTPKELHKWIKIMLDAYHLNKEETDLTEARQMGDPIIIQRLNILKETIEDEYMKTNKQDEGSEPKD